MKRKTLPARFIHPTKCSHHVNVWRDRAILFGGSVDERRKRRATYLMTVLRIEP